MRFLFIHQQFPAQYWRLVEWLRDNGHEIMFITAPTANTMRNVRKVEYQCDLSISDSAHAGARRFDAALRRADVVGQVAAHIKDSGFRPDIIIGHHGWGELLNIQDVFPHVPLLGYFEYYYIPHGYASNFDPEFPPPVGYDAHVRASNALNLISLTNPGLGQTPTRFQLGMFPRSFHDKIRLIAEGVDLVACAPDPAARHIALDLAEMNLAGRIISPDQKLVTYVANTLEPLRGLHILMRALPRLLRRADVQVVIVGNERGGYGASLPNITWKEHFEGELKGAYDASRVHFAGSVHYDSYRKLLRRSDVHVYLTYPFVASWSLREALACGCAIVASDTAPVHEFVEHGQTGLLTSFFDIDLLADRTLELLENEDLARQLRTNARAFAQEHLSLAETLATYRATIEDLTGTNPRSFTD